MVSYASNDESFSAKVGRVFFTVSLGCSAFPEDFLFLVYFCSKDKIFYIFSMK